MVITLPFKHVAGSKHGLDELKRGHAVELQPNPLYKRMSAVCWTSSS